MRLIHIGLFTLLFTTCILAQKNTELFSLTGQIGSTTNDDAIIQHVLLDKGSKLLLIGKNQLQFWDVASGKLIGSSPHKITGFWEGRLGFLRMMMNYPAQLEVSPDGRKGIMVANAPDSAGKPDKEKTPIVWNLENGDRLAILDRPAGPVRTVNFSENGSTIMTIRGELKEAELSFWNAATFADEAAITVQDLSFYKMSRDGGHVFIGSAKANKWLGVTLMGFESSKGIEVWNTRTGKLEKTYTDGDIKFWNPFNAGPSLSPDEKYLAARNEDNKIVVWETGSEGTTPKYKIGDDDLKTKFFLVGISDDSRYLLTTRDDEALIYEIETGKLYRRFPIRRDISYTLSGDSRYAIKRSEGWIGLYDLETEKTKFYYNLKTETEQHEDSASTESEVERPRLSPDGKFMLILGKDDVRIFDVATGEVVQTLVDPKGVKYKDNGKIKESGLNNVKGGWLDSGESIYVYSKDGRSLFLWNKK